MGSIITNDLCTTEMKSKIAMAKICFKRKENVVFLADWKMLEFGTVCSVYWAFDSGMEANYLEMHVEKNVDYEVDGVAKRWNCIRKIDKKLLEYIKEMNNNLLGRMLRGQ